MSSKCTGDSGDTSPGQFKTSGQWITFPGLWFHVVPASWKWTVPLQKMRMLHLQPSLDTSIVSSSVPWAKNNLVFDSQIWWFIESREWVLMDIWGSTLGISSKPLPLCPSTHFCLLTFQSVRSSWLEKETGRKRMTTQNYWITRR